MVTSLLIVYNLMSIWHRHASRERSLFEDINEHDAEDDQLPGSDATDLPNDPDALRYPIDPLDGDPMDHLGNQRLVFFKPRSKMTFKSGRIDKVPRPVCPLDSSWRPRRREGLSCFLSAI